MSRTASTPTTRDLAICAGREARMRRSAYPRWVQQGRMTEAQAAHEIACMDAIAARLTQDAAAEEAKGRLL
jgi:hypothetical protein